jgi:hypothetical protein
MEATGTLSSSDSSGYQEFYLLGYNIVECCLKAGISEAEQTSIASQRLNNVHIRDIAE